MNLLARLLRRPAPQPEPELPQASYAECVRAEVEGLEERAAFYEGTGFGAMLAELAADTRAELAALERAA